MKPPVMEMPDNVATAEPSKPEDTAAKPQVEKEKKNKKWLIIGIAALVFLLLCAIATIVLLLIRNGSNDGSGNTTPTPTATDTPSVTITESPTPFATETPSVTTTPTATPVPQSFIQGNVGYPSEFVPAMKICAVHTTSSKETCINKSENQQSYKVAVDPGSYRVYAQIQGQPDRVAFSTQEDAKGHAIQGGQPEWQNEGFVCHTNTACTAWFKPAVISIAVGATKTASIGEGWYLPTNEEWSNF